MARWYVYRNGVVLFLFNVAFSASASCNALPLFWLPSAAAFSYVLFASASATSMLLLPLASLPSLPCLLLLLASALKHVPLPAASLPEYSVAWFDPHASVVVLPVGARMLHQPLNHTVRSEPGDPITHTHKTAHHFELLSTWSVPCAELAIMLSTWSVQVQSYQWLDCTPKGCPQKRIAADIYRNARASKPRAVGITAACPPSPMDGLASTCQ